MELLLKLKFRPTAVESADAKGTLQKISGCKARNPCSLIAVFPSLSVMRSRAWCSRTQ